jgi:hypothetical protein
MNVVSLFMGLLMMKLQCVFLVFMLLSCGTNSQQRERPDSTSVGHDTNDYVSGSPEIYANETFKEVTVKKIAEHEFKIKGKGKINETAFTWVVEDGHRELKKGYVAPDEGAPAWGKFTFTINVEKEDPNSTLHLILFEASPKGGNRKHELSIPLK